MKDDLYGQLAGRVKQRAIGSPSRLGHARTESVGESAAHREQQREDADSGSRRLTDGDAAAIARAVMRELMSSQGIPVRPPSHCAPPGSGEPFDTFTGITGKPAVALAAGVTDLAAEASWTEVISYRLPPASKGRMRGLGMMAANSAGGSNDPYATVYWRVKVNGLVLTVPGVFAGRLSVDFLGLMAVNADLPANDHRGSTLGQRGTEIVVQAANTHSTNAVTASARITGYWFPAERRGELEDMASS